MIVNRFKIGDSVYITRDIFHQLLPYPLMDTIVDIININNKAYYQLEDIEKSLNGEFRRDGAIEPFWIEVSDRFYEETELKENLVNALMDMSEKLEEEISQRRRKTQLLENKLQFFKNELRKNLNELK